MNRRTILLAAIPSVIAPWTVRGEGVRISADPSDPGFDAFIAARAADKNIHVFLNGRELNTDNIGIADEREGFVESLKLDALGNIRFENGGFVVGRV